MRKKQSSILDSVKDDIEKYLNIGISIRCIYKLINFELNKKGIDITYSGFYAYIKRKYPQMK